MTMMITFFNNPRDVSMRIDKRMLDDIPAWFERQDDIPGGWIMANLYPLRATNPDDLSAKADKRLKFR